MLIDNSASARAKGRNRMRSLIAAAAAAVALAILPAAPAMAAAPGPHSITGCTLSDGTTETTVYRVEQRMDVPAGSGPNLTFAIAEPSKTFYAENGFVNRATGEFIMLGGGTRLFSWIPVESYAPPADLAHWIATQRMVPDWMDYYGVTTEDWYYEFRYFATQGNDPLNPTSDTTGEPLCKVTIDLAAVSNVSVVASEGGTATASATSATAADELTLTAVPDEGYEFVEWSCTGGELTDPTSTATTLDDVTADVTCTATFAAVQSPPSGGGDTEGDGDDSSGPSTPDTEVLAATGAENMGAFALVAGVLLMVGFGAIAAARPRDRSAEGAR